MKKYCSPGLMCITREHKQHQNHVSNPLVVFAGQEVAKSKATSMVLNSSGKVSLRKVSERDGDSLLGIIDKQTCLDLNIDIIDNLEQARQFTSGVGSTHEFRYVVLDENKHIIGLAAHSPLQSEGTHGSVVISYFIAKTRRKKGYATGAIQQLLSEIYQVYGTHVHVRAIISQHNIASRQLVKKLGFCRQPNCEPQTLHYVLTPQEIS